MAKALRQRQIMEGRKISSQMLGYFISPNLLAKCLSLFLLFSNDTRNFIDHDVNLENFHSKFLRKSANVPGNLGKTRFQFP